MVACFSSLQNRNLNYIINMNAIRPVILIIVILFASSIFAQELTIHCVNVGQGDCTVIESPSGNTMMVDNGPYAAGTSLVSYLDSLGISHFTWMIITHYHSDHIGNTSYLIQQGIQIDSVFDRGWSYCTATYENYYEPYVRNVRHTVQDSQVFDFGDGVTCRIVSVNGNGRLNEPFISNNCPGGGPNDENDFSVAMVVSYGQFDFYVGGDLSGMNTSSYTDIETFVAPEVGDVEVYQVNHHGSYSSSNLNFLTVTDPEVSIISLGHNSYGHPNPATVQRLLATSEVYQTEDGNGNIVDGNVVIRYAGDNFYTVNGDTFDVATSIADDSYATLPEVVSLKNYPNPFNAQTVIKYDISKASAVTITIYDMLGRPVALLVDDYQQAGRHQITWDAKKSASGLYFYKLNAGDLVETGKMLLIK